MTQFRMGERIGSLGLAVGLRTMMLTIPTAGAAQVSTLAVGRPSLPNGCEVFASGSITPVGSRSARMGRSASLKLVMVMVAILRTPPRPARAPLKQPTR